MSTTDVPAIQSLIHQIQALADKIESFPGIGNSTGADAAPVHQELLTVRNCCQKLLGAIGTGKG
ncbi:MAG TPA: hypothetical protein VGO11_03795 [Chthoniobacteraceae bacterium]|nr:hypothetical protein [Chthoniobacteraceae bacterium]